MTVATFEGTEWGRALTDVTGNWHTSFDVVQAAAAIDVSLQFTIADRDGNSLATTSVHLRRRLVLGSQVELSGSAFNGALETRMQLGPDTFRLMLRAVPDARPTDAADAARFSLLYGHPNVAVISNADGQTVVEGDIPVSNEPEPMTELIELLDDLAAIEAFLGVEFRVPREFSPELQRDVHVGAALIRGYRVRETWHEHKLPVRAADVDDLRQGLLGEGAVSMQIEGTWDVPLPKGSVQIGPVVFTFDSARVSEWPDTKGLAPDEEVLVPVEPGSSDGMTALLTGAVTKDDEIEHATFVPKVVYDSLVASLHAPPSPPPALAEAFRRWAS